METTNNETLDWDSKGFIYYKGKQVEHYTAVSYDSIADMIADPKCGGELLKRCQHLEKLGITPTTSEASWTWNWFKEIENKHDPFLFFASNYKDLYIKDQIVVFNKSQEPLKNRDEEGTFSGEWKYEIRLFNLVSRKILDVSVITTGAFYHYIIKKGYKTLNAGQKENLGGIYASKHQWEKTCKNYKIPYYIFDTNESFWRFACESMSAGYEVEVSEHMYDHFLNCMPPLVMRYPYNQGIYFINSEPVDSDRNGKYIYYAFTQKNNQYFGTTLVPDHETLINCKY